MSAKDSSLKTDDMKKGAAQGKGATGRGLGQGSSFADIYSQWMQTHDEDKAISKRLRDRSQGEGRVASGQAESINAIRQMKAQAVLDLHNYRLEESFVAVRGFLDDCKARGLRKVLVITGKGIHSAGGESVLRPAVSAAIDNHPAVRETFTPKAVDGGSGAIAVILKA